MARIRSIKPEFPQSETVGKLTRDARLLFIQLWTIVDDSGRARASSRMLASLLYPYDDDVPALIDGWLDELERHDCIRRYTIDGSHYLDVPKWLKHQKIDKPSPSKLPQFDEASRTLATDLDLGKGSGPRTKDREKEFASLTLSVEENFSLTEEPPPQTNGVHAYPEDFEDLWREYRVVGPKTASKAAAYKGFAKLSSSDRSACWSGVVNYAVLVGDERKKRPDYPVKHLATFINERGWEPFLEDVA